MLIIFYSLASHSVIPSSAFRSLHVCSLLLSDLAQGEYVSAFRQAPRQENALPITNAGMRVLFEEGTDIIKDLSIFCGGAVLTTVCAKQTCGTLIGRYNFSAFSVSLNKGTWRTCSMEAQKDFTCLTGASGVQVNDLDKP